MVDQRIRRVAVRLLVLRIALRILDHLLLRHLVDQLDRHVGVLQAVFHEHQFAARLERFEACGEQRALIGNPLEGRVGEYQRESAIGVGLGRVEQAFDVEELGRLAFNALLADVQRDD